MCFNEEIADLDDIRTVLESYNTLEDSFKHCKEDERKVRVDIENMKGIYGSEGIQHFEENSATSVGRSEFAACREVVGEDKLPSIEERRVALQQKAEEVALSSVACGETHAKQREEAFGHFPANFMTSTQDASENVLVFDHDSELDEWDKLRVTCQQLESKEAEEPRKQMFENRRCMRDAWTEYHDQFVQQNTDLNNLHADYGTLREDMMQKEAYLELIKTNLEVEHLNAIQVEGEKRRAAEDAAKVFIEKMQELKEAKTVASEHCQKYEVAERCHIVYREHREKTESQVVEAQQTLTAAINSLVETHEEVNRSCVEKQEEVSRKLEEVLNQEYANVTKVMMLAERIGSAVGLSKQRMKKERAELQKELERRRATRNHGDPMENLERIKDIRNQDQHFADDEKNRSELQEEWEDRMYAAVQRRKMLAKESMVHVTTEDKLAKEWADKHAPKVPTGEDTIGELPLENESKIQMMERAMQAMQEQLNQFLQAGLPRAPPVLPTPNDIPR